MLFDSSAVPLLVSQDTLEEETELPQEIPWNSCKKFNN